MLVDGVVSPPSGNRRDIWLGCESGWLTPMPGYAPLTEGFLSVRNRSRRRASLTGEPDKLTPAESIAGAVTQFYRGGCTRAIEVIIADEERCNDP